LFKPGTPVRDIEHLLINLNIPTDQLDLGSATVGATIDVLSAYHMLDEAGGIITNDDGLAKKLRQLRDHGQSEKYKHEFWAHNCRMDGIQGAVLGVKLEL
jgi:hypothetical protein